MNMSAISNRVRPSRHLRGQNGFALCIVAMLCLFVTNSRAASLQDIFANREKVTNTSGTIIGSNTNATVETGEPKHGGKPGGRSVWISWIAPTNGVATFDTHGSSFDTTLSAYYFGNLTDTNLNQLHEAARNDDDPNTPPTSLIQFGAIAGQRYEIAVDGFFGANGNVTLNWSFISAASPPPVIISTPDDQSGKQGDTISLTVNMTTTAGLQLKWFFYDNEVGVNGTNLTIVSLQPTNVGVYSLRIDIGAVRFFTTPVELQINSDGITNVLARDKILDSPSSPLIGVEDNGGGGGGGLGLGIRPLGNTGVGVVSGYNGSQIFNTTLATTDPTEPAHCSVSSGSSYWLAYQPPANGTLTLDTIGSSYDTVIEAYTYNGTITGYQDLIPIDCDNDSIATNGASRIQFATLKSRQYLVVVAGVNGARGVAKLNYSVDTNKAPIAPMLLTQPATISVKPGTPVSILPELIGAPPMKYAWKKNGTNIVGATAFGLSWPSVVTNDTGNYTVTVTNDLGGLEATWPLHVIVPPGCDLTSGTNGLTLSVPTVAGFLYTVEETTNLLNGWTPWPGSVVGNGLTNFFTLENVGTKFYRVRVE